MKNGIVIINKEKNKTSREIVNEVCKKFQTKKVGHTGTLDPLATGVLVLGVNEGTKLIEYLTATEKEYIAEVLIGYTSDTLDITGNIQKEKELHYSKEQVEEVLNSFIGTYDQEVPIYSAVHVDGKRLYEYARERKEVELPTRPVEIKKIKLVSLENQKFTFMVIVSKGTYIRSLIRDIGKKLGSPCIMSNLQRTRQGCFTLEKAKNVQELIEHDIISLKDAMEDYPRITITEEAIIKKIKNGCKLPNCIEKMTCLLDKEENLLAIYTPVGEMMKPLKVFHEE